MWDLHEKYFTLSDEMRKWRLTYEGGREFIDAYLRKFSSKESEADFSLRRTSAYCPNLCAAAINEYLNRFISGLSKVTRIGNSQYLNQVEGKSGGVCGKGKSLNLFLAEEVLPELMPMGRVGIYVDNSEEVTATLAESPPSPYFSVFKREQIKNWRYGRDGLTHLHLEYKHRKFNKQGFPNGYEIRDLYFVKTISGIRYWETSGGDQKIKEGVLEMSQIPFVDLWLKDPLMKDIADHQIALLNIESSDIQYILEANFPFLVEQYQKVFDYQATAASTNEEFVAKTSSDPEYQQKHGATSGTETPVGSKRGMRYGMNLEAPSFIHPSSEPLMASIQKQKQIEEQIRKILMLSVINLKGISASEQSRQESNQTVDSGLYVLGQILESAENRLSNIWSEYTNTTPTEVIYPTKYSILTEDQVSAVVKRFKDTLSLLPSREYQGHVAEELITNLLPGLKPEDLEKIKQELQPFTTLISDPDVVREDVEVGLVSKQFASELRGYPEGDIEIADDEHATRLARIQAAQTQGERGIPDLGVPDDGKREKEIVDPRGRSEERNRTSEDSDDS